MWQFLQGLSLSARGIKLFRGLDLEVFYLIFIKKLVVVYLRSKSQCSRNWTLSGFGSRGCLLDFYQKTHGSFSEVQILVLGEMDSFGVWVLGLLIGFLSKPMVFSLSSELTLSGFVSQCFQLEFYQKLWQVLRGLN